MIIKNGRVFCEDGRFRVRDLFIEGCRIVATPAELSDSSELDATGLLVVPGLIDIHSHGACGHDFCDADAEGLREILRYEKKHGITSYCPTSMTLLQEQLFRIYASALAVQPAAELAALRGINMEGPFLDPAKRGAHDGRFIVPPSVNFFHSCNEACRNMIKLVTVAPNAAGAMEFIRALHDEVTISLGHSAADYDTSMTAFRAGARGITHLYNAMSPFEHRAPGLVGAAADSLHCMAELIADGVHVHPSAVRCAFKLFGPERIVLISDSIRATGMKDGVYELGGQDVHVRQNRATLADGTIAGSVTNLFECLKKAVSFGIPLETALLAATANPARHIGIYDRSGSLTPGKDADILLLDEKLNLHKVL